MRPSEALKSYRDGIQPAVQSQRASNARVFGSVLHGTDAEGSNLDLLVDPLPGATLLDLGGLQGDLEEMLGVPSICSRRATCRRSIAVAFYRKPFLYERQRAPVADAGVEGFLR